MKKATLKIKRHHRNLYDVLIGDNETKDLHQCEMVVLLANRLIITLMDGCDDDDDIEIIFANYGGEKGKENQ